MSYTDASIDTFQNLVPDESHKRLVALDISAQ